MGRKILRICLILIGGVSLMGAVKLDKNTDLDLNRKGVQKILDQSPALPFTFAILGDHRDNTKGAKVFSRIARKINRSKPAFVVHLGDMVTNGSKKEYEFLLWQLDRFRSPVVTVMGNHDARKNGSVWYTRIFGPSNYYFDLHGWRFVVFNNSRDIFVGEKELDWLEKVLKTGKRKLVFVHKPGRIKRWERGYTGKHAVRFVQIMEKNNVEAVFAGHYHLFDSMEHEGVEWVISGGGGSPLHRHRLFGDSRYHFLLVTVERDHVRFKPVFLKEVPIPPVPLPNQK